MLVFPNAKINIGLNVVSRRPDGYHNLETFFYPISLCDALEFIPAAKTELTVVGKSLDGTPETNLVMRAFRLLQNRFHLPELAICLQKHIPTGAGLGGGSADAAFMVKALNTYFDLQLSDDELENYAAELGADCAFFVRNRPTLATGIGNEFEPFSLSLSGWHLLLVKPNIHISTAEAYARVQPRPWEVPLRELLALPISEWRYEIRNDFEVSCFAAHPVLAQIKAEMYDLGATYAAMSGSGSAMYGLFSEKPPCRKWSETASCDSFCFELK